MFFFLQRNFFNIFIFAYVCVCTLVVAFRDVSVGADTERYVIYFDRVGNGFVDSRYEPLFEALTHATVLFSDSVFVYFAIIFLVFNFAYFYGVSSFSRASALSSIDKAMLGVLLVSFCLCSSWYFTATTNALRHGVSLSFLYLSLLLCGGKRYFSSMAFYLVAVGFHYSTVLLLPFFAVFFVGFRWLPVVFGLVSIMYPLGVNEFFVKMGSDISGLSLYEKLSMYAEDEALWVGFQWDFFIYSIFWFFLFWLMAPLVREGYLIKYRFLVRAYAFLLFPYMVFGFGGFSNRYAFIAWLFLPIIQAFAVVMLRFGLAVKLLVGVAALLVGAFFQASRFGGLMDV
ncbi:EpsG family protein [Pseudomonas sp. D2-3]